MSITAFMLACHLEHSDFLDAQIATFDAAIKDKLVHRLLRRIEQLGYAVNLEPIAVAAD